MLLPMLLLPAGGFLRHLAAPRPSPLPSRICLVNFPLTSMRPHSENASSTACWIFSRFPSLRHRYGGRSEQ